jgi:uncharacterized protein with von Willebrand factor type A (vWA) domain
MRSIGNNINQMTRYSHQLQHAADIRQVLEQLRRMDLEVRAFVQGRLTHADAPAG